MEVGIIVLFVVLQTLVRLIVVMVRLIIVVIGVCRLALVVLMWAILGSLIQ